MKIGIEELLFVIEVFENFLVDMEFKELEFIVEFLVFVELEEKFSFDDVELMKDFEEDNMVLVVGSGEDFVFNVEFVDLILEE